jgi:hypothetical protein
MSLIKKESGTMSSIQAMNILSRYLPTYRPILSQLTSIHPRRIMQTLNGKLIAKDISDLDKLQQKIENLTQQFEHLELQMTTMSEKDKIDYFQQIVSVQLSLQKLERIYSRMLSTTILAAIGIASWSVFLGFNHDQFPVKQISSTVDSALTKPPTSR